MFQNANLSVRVTDEFMQAVVDDEAVDHPLGDRCQRSPARRYQARDVMARMAEGAWQCGDPGVQYDTTINNWHTCPNSGRINASNPCSEYMFLDDTACNLASINLMKFRQADGTFDVERFRTLAGCSSSPRKSWSITPAIRRSGSPRTATSSARWASATRTSAA